MQKAFFGRFERQCLSHVGSLSTNAKKAEDFKKYLITLYRLSKESELSELFCGYNSDTIPSAITYIHPQQQLDSISDNQAEDSKQDDTKQLLELFSSLRHPAKIVDLVIKSSLDLDSVDQTFMTFVKTHFCKCDKFMYVKEVVEQVLKASKKNSNKEMLLILTCDLECNAFQRKWRSKRVSEYMKVNHLEKDVKEFFESTSKDQFILQYQHKSEDLTQFFQTKCILETAYSLYYDEEETKHDKLIVLI
ncbi:hypothetical protein RFI_35126, partial [Reticulomyxa filosa]